MERAGDGNADGTRGWGDEVLQPKTQQELNLPLFLWRSRGQGFRHLCIDLEGNGGEEGLQGAQSWPLTFQPASLTWDRRPTVQARIWFNSVITCRWFSGDISSRVGWRDLGVVAMAHLDHWPPVSNLMGPWRVQWALSTPSGSSALSFARRMRSWRQRTRAGRACLLHRLKNHSLPWGSPASWCQACRSYFHHE